MMNMLKSIISSLRIEFRRSYSQTLSFKSAACLILAFSAILLVKAFHYIDNPQFWAEDGRIFFLGARQYGLTSLCVTYAGYHHLIARCIAYIASLFDGTHAPAIYFWFSFAIEILVIYFVYTSPLFKSVPAKIFAALSLILSRKNDVTGRGHLMIAEPIQNGFPPCISDARFRNLIIDTDNHTFRKSLFRRLYLNAIGILRELYARHLNHHLWHIKHHILRINHR